MMLVPAGQEKRYTFGPPVPPMLVVRFAEAVGVPVRTRMTASRVEPPFVVMEA
jgi:hypothetical protein